MKNVMNTMGWDIGGAHVKAAFVDRAGELKGVIQVPCPLWQGIDHLHRVIDEILSAMPATDCRHALTMTGELVDLFENRQQGVLAIIEAACARFDRKRSWVFAGDRGFLSADAVASGDCRDIASSNWLCSAKLCADALDQALLVDIGSTTTDILIIRDGVVDVVGRTDYERLKSDELVYTGVVRTPVMALAGEVMFQGERVGLMAEYFATAADVYRISGELPAGADQHPPADGGPKSVAGSRRRLARMLGLDDHQFPEQVWQGLASALREIQLQRLDAAIRRQLSRGKIGAGAPLVGAGVGRFLVKILAMRLARPYVDWHELVPGPADSRAGDCAPAAAVARLAWRDLGGE